MPGPQRMPWPATWQRLKPPSIGWPQRQNLGSALFCPERGSWRSSGRRPGCSQSPPLGGGRRASGTTRQAAWAAGIRDPRQRARSARLLMTPARRARSGRVAQAEIARPRRTARTGAGRLSGCSYLSGRLRVPVRPPGRMPWPPAGRARHSARHGRVAPRGASSTTRPPARTAI